MALRVTLAGRVGIEVDGGEVAAAGLGRPGRLALAYLTCERHRSVARDELAEVLWGDELPQSWEQMLRGVAFKLRAVLSAAGLDPSNALSTAAGAFRLYLPAGAPVVVEVAAAAGESAVAALAAGYPGAARAQASAALTVAARQFAPTTAGAWVERRQAELAELHLRALETLARAALAEGDWASAIAAAEEAVARQPFRESAYLVLMDAHAGAGNRGEALRAYSRCRDVLVEELGVDPSPPTEAAYLRLLGDEPAPAEVSSHALPLPPALAPVPGSFLVGRAAQVEALEAALKQAGVEGRQGVLVGGEPGAGKTTLVASAARAAHAGGARVLYGRCDEELGLAYQPFAQALGHYVAAAPTAELKAHVASHGGVLGRLVPELTRRLPEATPPPPTDAESDRWALFEAVTDVLVRAATDTTVVLVLDDLHWAAPGSLALVRHLLADPSPAALLVLGTYRHTDTPPGSSLDTTLADLRRAPGVERMRLEGLDADGVAAFVEAAGTHDDGGLARAVYAHTAGNPFFVGELLRHLTETGATYRRQAPWSYYADAQGLEVPEAAVEVVGRRLGRLSPDANRALVLASVTGAEFDLEVIEAAEADRPDTVLDGLEEAQAASLIVELDRPGHYRFAHALVRDAIYGKLSAVRRARLHRQVGEALESLPGDDADRLPALAHHFAEAAVAGGAGRAAEYALRAAEHAVASSQAENAVAILERGLRALDVDRDADKSQRVAILLALSWAYFFSGANEEGVEVGLRAAEEARTAGTVEQFAEAAVLQSMGGFGYGGEIVEEALDRLGELRPDLRARLLAALARTRKPFDDVSDRLSADALALARSTCGPEDLRRVIHERWTVVLGTPDVAELLTLADELVERGVNSFGPASGHDARALSRLINGDREGFDAEVAEQDRLGRETRAWGPRSNAARWQVVQALLDGRFDEVGALAAHTNEVFAERRKASPGRYRLSMLFWEQGRVAELEAMAVRRVAAQPGQLLPRARLALARAALGQTDIARADLVELTLALPGVQRVQWMCLAGHLVELAAMLEDEQCAAPLYEKFLPYRGQVVAGMIACCLGSVDRHLGMMASVLGRWDEAEAHFEAALVVDGGMRSPPLLARTRYWFARMLAARPGGDRQKAGALADKARATAVELGMALLADQAGRVLLVNARSTPHS